MSTKELLSGNFCALDERHTWGYGEAEEKLRMITSEDQMASLNSLYCAARLDRGNMFYQGVQDRDLSKLESCIRSDFKLVVIKRGIYDSSVEIHLNPDEYNQKFQGSFRKYHLGNVVVAINPPPMTRIHQTEAKAVTVIKTPINKTLLLL